MHPYLNIHFGGERLLQAFSWMLIHSLWQGLLLAVVTAVLLQLTKRTPARLRYNITLVQFVLFILACVWTFVRGMNSPSDALLPLAGTIGQNASQLLQLDAASVRQFADACADYISTHASLLVLVWAVFFTFRSFRMVQGLIYLQKARHKHTRAAAHWNERLALLCRKLGIHNGIQLLESAYVKVPMVIGHLKPVILMPAGLLTGLPSEQIEAVLLHELAHIRRHDYIVNLLQTICETIYFFNPGLLWISALLRDEREHCCDDIALGETGNKKEFIQALISFKEHAMYSHSAAVAFPGKKNQLLQRVSRIINNKNQSLGTGEKVFFMAGIILLTAILSTAAITQLRDIEQDIFSEKITVSRYYDVPPAQQQSAAIVGAEDTPPAKTAGNVTERKHHPANDKTTTSQAVGAAAAQPMEVLTTDLVQENNEEKPQADNIRQEQPQNDRYYENRAPVYRRPYLPESNRRLNTLTASMSVESKMSEQVMLREAAERRREEEGLARIQVEKDRQQADRDRIQADRDREQAVRDRIQADKDREQARLDRLQADRDKEQALKDRAQAEKDRARAHLDRIQAEKDRAQFERKKKEQTQFPVI
jgi:beta-lactamase regulating signal transducer with metallopeptidase domain